MIDNIQYESIIMITLEGQNCIYQSNLTITFADCISRCTTPRLCISNNPRIITPTCKQLDSTEQILHLKYIYFLQSAQEEVLSRDESTDWTTV